LLGSGVWSFTLANRRKESTKYCACSYGDVHYPSTNARHHKCNEMGTIPSISQQYISHVRLGIDHGPPDLSRIFERPSERPAPAASGVLRSMAQLQKKRLVKGLELPLETKLNCPLNGLLAAHLDVWTGLGEERDIWLTQPVVKTTPGCRHNIDSLTSQLVHSGVSTWQQWGSWRHRIWSSWPWCCSVHTVRQFERMWLPKHLVQEAA